MLQNKVKSLNYKTTTAFFGVVAVQMFINKQHFIFYCDRGLRFDFRVGLVK